jgi:short-subunit dehydrogenase
VKEAARQIFTALEKKKKLVYITHRWRLIAWLLRILPEFILKKF